MKKIVNIITIIGVIIGMVCGAYVYAPHINGRDDGVSKRMLSPETPLGRLHIAHTKCE